MAIDNLGEPLRSLLERGLRRFADEGHMPLDREREVTFRIGTDGHVRWFEARTIRVPASKLEPAGDAAA